MAFVSLADGARMVIVYGDTSFEHTNNLYLQKAGWGEADPPILANDVHAAWVALVNRPLASAYKLKAIRIYDMRGENEPIYNYTFNTTAGTQTGEVTDKSSAVVVTLRSAFRGRSGRGRLYIGGLSEGNMQSGLWTAGIVTQAHNWVNNILAACLSAGWIPVIMSRMRDGVPRNPAEAHVITSIEVRNNIPGSQDRRNHRP